MKARLTAKTPLPDGRVEVEWMPVDPWPIPGETVRFLMTSEPDKRPATSPIGTVVDLTYEEIA